MAHLSLRLLGGFLLRAEARPRPLAARKAQALLAHAAARAPGPAGGEGAALELSAGQELFAQMRAPLLVERTRRLDAELGVGLAAGLPAAALEALPRADEAPVSGIIG